MDENLNRTLRAPDDLWLPFLELTTAAEKMSGAMVLRRFMLSYLEEFRVFWAPIHPDGGPETPHAAFYECEECDRPHRLDGSDKGTWGCSPIKARVDRMEKAAKG